MVKENFLSVLLNRKLLFRYDGRQGDFLGITISRRGGAFIGGFQKENSSPFGARKGAVSFRVGQGRNFLHGFAWVIQGLRLYSVGNGCGRKILGEILWFYTSWVLPVFAAVSLGGGLYGNRTAVSRNVAQIA